MGNRLWSMTSTVMPARPGPTSNSQLILPAGGVDDSGDAHHPHYGQKHQGKTKV